MYDKYISCVASYLCGGLSPVPHACARRQTLPPLPPSSSPAPPDRVLMCCGFPAFPSPLCPRGVGPIHRGVFRPDNPRRRPDVNVRQPPTAARQLPTVRRMRFADLRQCPRVRRSRRIQRKGRFGDRAGGGAGDGRIGL